MLADDHVAHARNYARRRLGILSREREQRQPTASRRTHSNRRAECVELPRAQMEAVHPKARALRGHTLPRLDLLRSQQRIGKCTPGTALHSSGHSMTSRSAQAIPDNYTPMSIHVCASALILFAPCIKIRFSF